MFSLMLVGTGFLRFQTDCVFEESLASPSITVKFFHNAALRQTLVCWALSQLRICRPPPPHSEVVNTWKTLRKMCNVLIRAGKTIKKFYGFYFSSYGCTKTTITPKKIIISKSEIWFFFHFSRFQIFQINFKIFEQNVFFF